MLMMGKSVPDEELEKTWDLLDVLSDKVAKESTKWKDKLPYHINLLDIWWPYEPEHSAILCRILQCRTPSGEYEILKSLITFIGEQLGNDAFTEITVKNPRITKEDACIDLLVQDEDYAIIIENKSNGASDQWKQLKRYVENVARRGYTSPEKEKTTKQERPIFLLYLPPFPGKEPEEQSWGTFKKSFEVTGRYVNLSFRDGVIPWLKECVFPNVRNKDIHLLSALAQYIDHWDGRCGLRINEKEKNMNIEDIIKTNLEISTDSSNLTRFGDYVEKVMRKKREFTDVTSCLDRIEQQLKGKIFDDTVGALIARLNGTSMTMVPEQSRSWQVIRRSEWTVPSLEVHFEYGNLCAERPLVDSIAMMVHVEWRGKDRSKVKQFIDLFDSHIFPKIKNDFHEKNFTRYSKFKYGIELARKEYPCGGSTPDEKIYNRKEAVLKAWDEFQFLSAHIDETFQLLENASQMEQQS